MNKMKKLLSILTIALCAISVQAQEETGYSYVNQGINIMLEAEGTGNQHMGFGGIAFTIGYQINPNIFIGGGIKTDFGATKSNWDKNYYRYDGYYGYDGRYHNDDKTFWVDDNGKKWRYHGFFQDGTEVYMNSWDDINYVVDDNGFTVRPTIYDENNNQITDLPEHDRYYYTCDDDCGTSDIFCMMIPFICLKYNILGMKRVTPYTDIRLGWNLCRDQEYAKYGANINAMLGIRIGVGEGDFAINISAGYNYTDLRGFNNQIGRESCFMIRTGVEF